MPGLLTHINLARGFRGGERQMELLVRGLAERGIAQRAVLRRGAPLVQRLATIPGLECHVVATPWLPRPRLLRASLVHAHEARAAHLAHVTHRLTGRPYVITRRAWERPRDKALNRALYRRAAAVVAISDAVRGRLREFDAWIDPEVIHSAADPAPPDEEAVSRLRQRWRGRFVVGHVGALVERHKGQRVLIAAARRLARDIPELQVVFLGEGPDGAELRRAAGGCPGIEFAGFVPDVSSYLAAFDVFAFPSRYEALGSTLLDAMCAGLPAVAAAVGGIPEVIRHGREGLLVPPGDEAAFADALLALYRDAGKRRQLGEVARLRSQEFSAARMTDSYLKLYERIALGGLA